MSAESFLSSVVEVAIGIGGFAGIIAAIRQGRLADWPADQRILLQMLLVASAAAISFALLPSILAEAQLDEPTIWRIGSALLLAWQVGIAVHRTRQFRSFGVTPWFPRLLGVWVAGIIAFQVANLGLAMSWPYLVGVFGLLVNGFSFFLLLLFGRGDPPPDAP